MLKWMAEVRYNNGVRGTTRMVRNFNDGKISAEYSKDGIIDRVAEYINEVLWLTDITNEEYENMLYDKQFTRDFKDSGYYLNVTLYQEDVGP